MDKTIRDLRIEHGWTQGELAEKLGVTGQLVSHWESGKGRPHPGKIPLIAEVFGITAEEARKAIEAIPLVDAAAASR